MMRMALALALLAGGLGWAQAPAAPGPANPGRRLFQAALAGVNAVPAPDQPFVRAMILSEELNLFPGQARAQLPQVFQQALDLPPGLSKQRAEEKIVLSLAFNWPEQALQLARNADIRRALLYNPILTLHARSWPLGQAEAIIAECAQSDGSFPYGGALAVARANADNVLALQQLFGEIYAAAGQAAAAADWSAANATPALLQGPKLAPELNGQLADTLVAVITVWSRHIRAPRPPALLLLRELRQIAPERAQQVLGQFPQLAAARTPKFSVDVGPGGKLRGFPRPDPAFRASTLAQTSPGAALQYALGLRDAQRRFAALTALAHQLSVLRQPALAHQAATQAYGMLTGALLATGDVGMHAARLLGELDFVGESGDAASLFPRLLQVGDAKAELFAARYDALPRSAGPDRPSQARMALFMDGQRPGNEVIEIYSAAAEKDFATAAARAEALPAPVLRPLVEAAVAALWRGPRR